MALLRYFTPVRNGGLPDPEGSLSSVLSPQAIEQANQEVLAVIQEEQKKRGTYHRYEIDTGDESSHWNSMTRNCH